MATPKIIADFETRLATSLAVAGTSFTLASATDDDGVSLPAGLYYFTVDNGTSNKEYLAGTLSGTSVTGVLSVSRQGAETSGAARAHRVGASCILTDFATYKKYMDEISLVSAPDASTSAKGVVEAATLAEVRARTATGSTGAVLVITPDVMDDLPTSAEKTALTSIVAGTYFTNPEVVTFTGSGTWTKDARLQYIKVQVQAGGGGGPGCDNSVSSSGAGGAYTEKIILASALASTVAVTVGAGGTAGSGASNGGTGGTSSFGTHLIVTGGGGGRANSTTLATAATVTTGGDFSHVGTVGGVPQVFPSSPTRIFPCSGSSWMSRPTGPTFVSLTDAAAAGPVSVGYGAGGPGMAVDSEPSAYSGTAGTAGVVIVTEYYS